MMITTSVLASLIQALPHLRQQVYFKSSLTALSHAMEDLVLAGTEEPLVIASFQRERFYRQEAHRYRRIAVRTSQVYVLAAPETDFKNSSNAYETIAFDPADSLAQEWHLIVIGQSYATCLLCQERLTPPIATTSLDVDSSRRFEGIWTFDRQVSQKAAELLLNRIECYRPELAAKLHQAKSQYLGEVLSTDLQAQTPQDITNPDPFVQRLVTYLQAGQYKLLKAYRSITAQEQRERLVNRIITAIRRSLKPEEILEVAVQELGQALGSCRCLIYRCKATDATATISHEFLKPGEGGGTTLTSLLGQTWPLRDNALFREVVQAQEAVWVENAATDPRINTTPPPSKTEGKSRYSPSTPFKDLVAQFSIRSLVMVPVLYQGQLLGIVELHHCGTTPYQWNEDELSLVNAIATQVGVALIQAEAYANLEDLNQQLAALDRTRSNLVAITGHELRTPLSTIQVCLESLASEPDMSPELRQVMLNTALADSERMRTLIQDFLTLSRLESGRVQWHLEPLSLQECVELAVSNVRTRRMEEEQPTITALIPDDLPLVRADGEWLVEALAKLLDNACKFTTPQGQVTIQTQANNGTMLEVTVSDTGRGIEPNRLEDIFDRFYQEEGALRRTTGGTGLGLAICRQIVKGWGGKIWADSAGKDQGSQFHFTVPIISRASEPKSATNTTTNSKRSTTSRKRSTGKSQPTTDNELEAKS